MFKVSQTDNGYQIHPPSNSHMSMTSVTDDCHPSQPHMSTMSVTDDCHPSQSHTSMTSVTDGCTHSFFSRFFSPLARALFMRESVILRYNH